MNLQEEVQAVSSLVWWGAQLEMMGVLTTPGTNWVLLIFTFFR